MASGSTLSHHDLSPGGRTIPGIGSSQTGSPPTVLHTTKLPRAPKQKKRRRMSGKWSTHLSYLTQTSRSLYAAAGPRCRVSPLPLWAAPSILRCRSCRPHYLFLLHSPLSHGCTTQFHGRDLPKKSIPSDSVETAPLVPVGLRGLLPVHPRP